MRHNPFYTLIHEDESFVILNKNSGILVAADRWDEQAPRLDTAAQGEFGQLLAVHRIDKDTSGILIYARNAEAHRTLSLAFENRQVDKTYHALVYGRPLWTNIDVDLRLLVDGDVRHRTIASRQGKDSFTSFHLIGICGQYSWLEAKPKTGRTHQIRVHLASQGFSIVCDPLYGGNQKPLRLSEIKRSWRGDEFEERPLLNRLALHAWKLSFAHPITGEQCTFTAPYPKDLEATRKQLFKIFDVDPLAV